MNTVLSALVTAGYPTPQVLPGTGLTSIVWGLELDVERWPQFTVFDTGNVVVTVDRHPDAYFNAADTATWLTVLHPHIADIIAHTALADLVPAPPPLRWGALPAFAYLIDDTDGMYAAYADGSRIWMSAADATAALDNLLGTTQGYQLGITTATAVAVATRDGVIYLNPALAHPTAEPAHTGYQPALAITDHIHLLPHPTSEHLVTPEEATAVAATRLHAVIATQAANGHIYPQH